jgi:putative ABC transport system substrate-binding protein
LERNNYSNRAHIGSILLTGLLITNLALSSCGLKRTDRIYHVGILSGLDAFAPAVDGFKNKMTELGYVEGENISYDLQSTNVDIDAYKRISKKFVDDKVDLIFVFPTEASMEAKAAAQISDVPVIFDLAFTDVAGIDLIKSVREPGGNLTGIRFPSVDIATKRLQILHEIAPTARRIWIPYLKGYPNVPGQLDAVHLQAQGLGVEIIEFAAASPQDLQTELEKRTTSDDIGIDAILMIAEPLTITPPFYAVIGKFAYQHQIPIGGALMAIGEDYESIFGLLPDAKLTGEQAALLADKVLKGTLAGTIPVVTADSYFHINYKAAQVLGVSVPESLLRQADEIIR